MKVISISDIHGNLIPYPSYFWEGIRDCEILFICGDIIPLELQFNMLESKKWLIKEFKMWATELPVEKVYIIAGNHDSWFERNKIEAHGIFSKWDKVTYLCNECIKHTSLQDSKVYKIFGTPYCHIFGNWPFMRSEEILIKKFNEIPENIDILFTHDAPYGASDVCLEGWAADGTHKGSPALAEAIINKKPLYCFHGHLHSTNHSEELLGETKIYNTSILDESYQIKYKPLIVKI